MYAYSTILITQNNKRNVNNNIKIHNIKKPPPYFHGAFNNKRVKQRAKSSNFKKSDPLRCCNTNKKEHTCTYKEKLLMFVCFSLFYLFFLLNWHVQSTKSNKQKSQYQIAFFVYYHYFFFKYARTLIKRFVLWEQNIQKRAAIRQNEKENQQHIICIWEKSGKTIVTTTTIDTFMTL